MGSEATILMLSLKEECCSGGISGIVTERGHILAPFRRQTVIQSLLGSATNAWDREVCQGLPRAV